MTDVHDTKTRSFNMSQIKGKNTKPEIMVRKFLFSKGFRYKLHDKKLSGKPDIVLLRDRTVIFVHGCFWHGHENCKDFVIPKTRVDFWTEKIETNRHRDKKNKLELNEHGWKTLVIYECELKGLQKEKTLNKLLIELNKISDQN